MYAYGNLFINLFSLHLDKLRVIKGINKAKPDSVLEYIVTLELAVVSELSDMGDQFIA